MRLLLQALQPDDWGGLSVQVLAVNDTYEPVRLDRRLLIGPNPVTDKMMPLAREAAAATDGDNFVELGPWCIYGRQRRCPAPTAHPFTFHAYLLRRPTSGLRHEGPADPNDLAVEASPLVVEAR